MRCPITFTAGSGSRTLELGPRERVVLGRSKRADLTVSSPRLSRLHCAVEWTEQGLQLEDLGSSNGTFLNGQRVQRAALRPGDIVQVGGVALRVTFDPSLACQLDLRCERCGRMVSMARCEDGQVFELGAQFLCPECATLAQHEHLSQAERSMVDVLSSEGFEVHEKLSLSSPLIPVFRCTRRELGTVCAVKALPLLTGVGEKKVRRFQKEARAAAKVRHPNVVEIYDIRQAEHLLYIVMEHVEGEPLLAHLERKGPLPLKAVLRVGLLVARALATAHEQGIVHRDLKPAGILITPEGTPKIVDFGLAKDLWSITGDITGPEETLGTVRYMPPEQVKNARQADHRADIYSLGATLFHLLTGRPPYSDRSELQLMGQVLSGALSPFDPTQADEVPPALGSVLARAMAADPERRYASAAELERGLGEAIVEVMGVPGYRGDPELLFSLDATRTGPYDTTWRGPTPEPGGMAGVFVHNELVEFLQMIETNTKSGLLRIRTPEGEGHLAFQQGRLRAAATGDGRRGDEAVSHLLGIREGRFDFRPTLPPGFRPQMDQAVSGLLLEALRRMDEEEAEETSPL
ncbi:MAG: DUF4388 domain-containing protein [Planctomycetota bacterium]|nr:MAG: DUF4388 domain-containing protein [Planctomycetota bacterium]